MGKAMTGRGTRRVALLYAQFAAYHVDRCQAVARRLDGRAEVLAVEVATTSATYAWEASGEVVGARKITLFPGQSYDDISWPRRLWRQLKTLWRCDMVFVGIGYNEVDVILLSWLLALLGVRVVVHSDSRFDDMPRRVIKEFGKALLLLPYCAAIVAERRHIDYFRFLGFTRRRVIPGYDTVGLDRIRAMGGNVLAPQGAPHAQRDFIFVGRFVEKKNLVELIEGFALYAKAAGRNARRLVLIGSGQEEAAIRSAAATLGVAPLIDFPGFLSAQEVAQRLAGGLALVLPSVEEQWGLVVNEALAFGLPVIVSPAVGSGDALVRNLQNGFVIERGAPAGIAAAMQALASDEGLWRRMVDVSHQRAWLGDTERLADAVEAICFPGSASAEEAIARLRASQACSPANARSWAGM